MSRVLVVDDERQIRRTLEMNLSARGFDVVEAASGEEALAELDRCPADLIILDLGLPGIDGLEVIRRVRARSAVPIVILSVRQDEHDKVTALDLGADDYVTKPFGIAELLARLRVALRHQAPDKAPTNVTTAAFTLDLVAKRATRNDGAEVRLTPIEWGIVEHLVRRPGRLVPQRELLQTVWGPEYGDETNYLRVHLAHIRQKLEPEPKAPRYILTEPGIGYRFEHDAPA